MIRLRRPPIRRELAADLARRTQTIRANGANTATGRAAWHAARDSKTELRAMLRQMAPGLERCMYCGDNLGTDIDHFEPIARAPLRTFDWHNHLLACAHCNSNRKRDLFPLDPDTGDRLLIDPAAEDPADHLLLLLDSGEYQALTAKGTATIEVFGLNSRPELVRGRRLMFTVVKSLLASWYGHHRRGEHPAAAEEVAALRLLAHADVLRAAVSLGRNPGVAETVLGYQAYRGLCLLARTEREFR